MSDALNNARLTPVTQMVGEDDEETQVLLEMAQRADEYIRSFGWCPPIKERRFGCGVGGVVAAFLFEFEASLKGTDKHLWVIVGDLPTAYLVTDDAPDGASALAVYCDLMEEWAVAVLSGASLDGVFPVGAAATAENASSLLSRISFIRREVVPKYRASHRVD